MRRVFLAGLVSLALAPAAPAQSTARTLEGVERTQALAQASAALNAQTRVQGRFRQVAPDGGATTGRFYLQRPGRVRFEYDPPAQMLIVADGSILAVHDRALRSTNRAPLRSTPLFFVLKANINLARDARITRVIRNGDALFISARDRSGQADGEITLRLQGPSLALHSWEVVDATGSRTRVALSEVSSPAQFDARLFRAPAASTPSPRGPGR